jgi:hypothetical protein
VVRVTCRLEGGGTDANLSRICVALGVGVAGKSKKYMQVEIELRLRAMQFSGDVSFVPTAAQVALKETNGQEFDRLMRVRQLPGYTPPQYEYLGYTIRQLCEILFHLFQSALGK